MHTFTLKPRLTWVCRHIEPGYYKLIWSSTHTHIRVSCMLIFPASHLVTTLSELVADHTLLWMINCCTHNLPGQVATGHSYQLIFVTDKSAPPLALSVPTTGMPSSSLRWIHGLFWEGMCLLYHKVSSQADWLMTRLIKTPDVLNNGAFVKESTEVLFHQEPVYLPF